jgi:hypothetical protein
MNKKTALFYHLCSQLTSLPQKHSTLTVGIDAPGGSGKSIFTRALAKRHSQCTIVRFLSLKINSKNAIIYYTKKAYKTPWK